MIIDFYEGYEGESELIISSKDNDRNSKRILKLWIGHFDKIMENIPPLPSGNWDGIALVYHTCSGWDEEEWLCNDKLRVLDQFEAVNKSVFDDLTRKVLEEVIKLFKYSITNNFDVYFLED